MVAISERDFPLHRLVSDKGRWVFEALEEAAPAHLHGDGKFVAVERIGKSIGVEGALLAGLREYIDELNDEIGIGA